MFIDHFGCVPQCCLFVSAHIRLVCLQHLCSSWIEGTILIVPARRVQEPLALPPMGPLWSPSLGLAVNILSDPREKVWPKKAAQNADQYAVQTSLKKTFETMTNKNCATLWPRFGPHFVGTFVACSVRFGFACLPHVWLHFWSRFLWPLECPHQHGVLSFKQFHLIRSGYTGRFSAASTICKRYDYTRHSSRDHGK